MCLSEVPDAVERALCWKSCSATVAVGAKARSVSRECRDEVISKECEQSSELLCSRIWCAVSNKQRTVICRYPRVQNNDGRDAIPLKRFPPAPTVGVLSVPESFVEPTKRSTPRNKLSAPHLLAYLSHHASSAGTSKCGSWRVG